VGKRRMQLLRKKKTEHHKSNKIRSDGPREKREARATNTNKQITNRRGEQQKINNELYLTEQLNWQ
jgi:hypothetical protein